MKGTEKMKKIIAGALTVVLAAACFAGCGKKQSSEGNEKFVLTTDDSYPIKTDKTLRMWATFTAASYANSANDLPITEYLEEATGIKVKWEHPAQGEESTSFNLMLASDDMPDMIFAGWQNVNNGPDYNLDKHIIADMTPYIEGGASPNYKKIMDENPELKKLGTSASNRYYAYFMLLGDEKLTSYMTFYIRNDILKKNGLEVPETLSEWETALYAIRDSGIKTPLMLKLTNYQLETCSPFMSCFNTAGTFYHVDGKVKFGPYEKAFGEWVKLMAKWYKDGILDVNFVDESPERWSAEITNGNNGAYTAGISSLATYGDAIKKDSGIEYVPCKIPVAKKGDRAMYAQKQFMLNNAGIAVSATSKNKELCARYLDFGYSEKGQMVYNFGKEGVSYTMETGADGKPTPVYTKLITDPKERNGLSFSQALGMYTRATMPISVQNINYLLQSYSYDTQKQALEYAYDTDTLKHKIPDSIFTTEQAKQISDIMTPINTYREETVAKIISGKMDIKELDTYFSKLKDMGIEKAIKIYQDAYNAYLKK